MIDRKYRVQVYKNLHKNCFSVKQRGKLVCYTQSIRLENVRFNVGSAGRKKVLRTGQKNVHAFVTGYDTDIIFIKNRREAFYDPKAYDTFRDTKLLTPVFTADYADLYINRETGRTTINYYNG